jgi:hypothetical protein
VEVSQPGPAALIVDSARDTTAAVKPNFVKAVAADEGDKSVSVGPLLAEEPWIVGSLEFSAPPAPPEAFPTRTVGAAPTKCPSFLGRPVGSIHESINFWKETLDEDKYVEGILKHGYKIPVKMTDDKAATVYRKKNNKSARGDSSYIRGKVTRLVAKGQVIKVAEPPRCTNPLRVAYKINADGSVKNRLVIDLSRWVNKCVVPNSYKMTRFQDALALLSRGNFQSVYNISKAYHHVRLHPDSYQLVGFCVEDENGKEELYHYLMMVNRNGNRGGHGDGP